ncbi:MAG: ribosomal protein S18-alanine N-acetyltransferase [Candidatus Aminicenantes bacterium]|nr:ribosomal protein S18-alanine N-acetyltransferase [Candidatus Aminicenantes bacterium]
MAETEIVEFDIRRMVPADLPEVLAIERQSFSNPWLESTFGGEIQNMGLSHPMVATARPGGEVIGYVLYWLVSEEMQINNVAVHPDWRRRRIGERMLRAVMDDAKRRGATYAILEVRQSNRAARTLYERTLGFGFLAVREDYYTQPTEDAIVLGLPL